MLSPALPYAIRYETRLKLEPSEKPNDECWSKLHKFLKTILEADKSAVLYPWSNTHNRGNPAQRHYKAILDVKKLPTNPKDWKVYFERGNPNKDGGFIYPSIYLGHSTPFDKLHETVKWFLTSDNCGWYERKLQVEQTRIIGWLMYSLRTMNTEALEEKLRILIGSPFSLRWRTISVPKQAKLPDSQVVKALHIECSQSDYGKAKLNLKKYYSSRSRWFPLGVKMRLIQMASALMGVPARKKIDSFRLKQKQFVAHMKAMRSWEIMGLDIDPGSNQPSLRELLNQLESNIEPGTQIFHSVDDSFQPGAVVFSFHPAREEEARMMVASLIPFLKWAVLLDNQYLSTNAQQAILSRRVYKHFTVEAIDRASEAIWNDVTNSVETPDDQDIMDLDLLDQEFDMSELIEDVDTDDVTLSSLDKLRTLIRPADVDIDDETQSTLASLPSKSDQSTKSTSSPKPKSKATRTQKPHSQSDTSNATDILNSIIPTMKALALQAGNSPDAILLRTSLEALEKRKPSPEAKAGAKDG